MVPITNYNLKHSRRKQKPHISGYKFQAINTGMQEIFFLSISFTSILVPQFCMDGGELYS